MPKKTERISVYGGNLKGLKSSTKKDGNLNTADSMRKTISSLRNIP